MVNEYWKRLLNAIVYVEFRVCSTFAKYENDMLSLGETINVFLTLFTISFTSVRTV